MTQTLQHGGISGTGSLTQAGTGLLVLNASNTYSGATTISAGMLVLANSNALQNSTAAVDAAANSLTFRRASARSIWAACPAAAVSP